MAELSQLCTLSNTQEAIVAHLDKAFGQDMLQEAMDELLGGQGTGARLARIRSAVAERDLIVLHFQEAAVADGDPKDVRGQIFEGRLAIANGLAMDDPVLFPDRGGNAFKEIGLAQGVPKARAKDAGQSLDRY